VDHEDQTEGRTLSSPVSGLAIFSARFSGVEVANWLNGSATKRNGTANNSTELSDGSHRPTSTPTALLVQPLHIGRRLNTGGSPVYIDADVFDMVIVNGMIIDEEVRYLEGVVAWDNNAVSLLPSDHPWKSTVPTASSPVPGIWGGPVVARSPAPKTRFLGSPSFLKAADGTFYFLYDVFELSLGLTGGDLYVSTNQGATWAACWRCSRGETGHRDQHSRRTQLVRDRTGRRDTRCMPVCDRCRGART
jgi:hypothetical protein